MPIKKLADGTQYEKATHHNEGILKGTWDVTLKIDGVRAMRNQDGAVVSRNGKPLYNLDHLQFQDAEIYRKDWGTSMSLVRTESYMAITEDDVYELGYTTYDDRLNSDRFMVDPTYDERMELMQEFVDKGYEGIVLRNTKTNKWVKVVPVLNADIRVTGFEMSTKRLGWIKNFTTDWGNISSTGFKEEELLDIEKQGAHSFVGMIAEVQYRETFPLTGKLRFAAFLRWRTDKDEESLT